MRYLLMLCCGLLVQGMGPAERRLINDFRELSRDPIDGVVAFPQENNLLVWAASITGPEDSPWEGGIFDLELRFPSNFPHAGPRVIFEQRLFHPNIMDDRQLCLDLLTSRWIPQYRVGSILMAIRSLLADPNPDSNNAPSLLLRKSQKLYEERVRAQVQQLMK